MSTVYKQALRNNQQKIAGGIIVENILSNLRPYLTKVEHLQVERKVGNVAQVNELFRILLMKENQHFEGFCDVLEATGYQHWAQELRSTADGEKAEGMYVCRCADLRCRCGSSDLFWFFLLLVHL